jgi:hypothetical protein
MNGCVGQRVLGWVMARLVELFDDLGLDDIGLNDIGLNDIGLNYVSLNDVSFNDERT